MRLAGAAAPLLGLLGVRRRRNCCRRSLARVRARRTTKVGTEGLFACGDGVDARDRGTEGAAAAARRRPAAAAATEARRSSQEPAATGCGRASGDAAPAAAAAPEPKNEEPKAPAAAPAPEQQPKQPATPNSRRGRRPPPPSAETKRTARIIIRLRRRNGGRRGRVLRRRNPPRPARPGAMVKGKVCVIVGLTSEASKGLNGLTGVILKHDEQNDRWTMKMDDTGKGKALKSKNLAVVLNA